LEEQKKCPFCREWIITDAIKCRYCGSMLSDDPSSGGVGMTALKQTLSGKYEILGEIGRGGMATVYKARQINLDRIVALKVLPPQFTHDLEFVKRFQDEARHSARVSHPNLIAIHDVGNEQNLYYISMEFLSGETLRDRIVREGALPENEIRRIIEPVAEGLATAHEQNLIHRDIKSSNIFLTDKGRPVLMDFGIAKALDSTQQMTQSGTVLGTPEYMSPEQARGDATGARSDIYSLGIVMYEMATGRLPFQGDHPLSTLNMIATQPPTPPKGINTNVSEELQGRILKCLEKEPGNRFQSATKIFTGTIDIPEQPEQIEQDIPKEMEEEAPIHVETSGSKPTESKGSGSLGKAIIGVAALIVVVAAIIGIRMFSGSGENAPGGGAVIQQQAQKTDKGRKKSSLVKVTSDVTPRYSLKLPPPKSTEGVISDLQKQRIANLLQDAQDQFNSGDLKQAFKTYELVQLVDSGNELAHTGMQSIYDTYLKRADERYQSGDYSGYDRINSEACDKFSSMQIANLHMRADRYFKDGRYAVGLNDAITSYQAVLKVKGDDQVAQARLKEATRLGMESSFKDGDYAGFETLGSQLIKYLPSEAVNLYNRWGDKYYVANRLLREGKHDAVNMYKRALKLESTNSYAMKQLELIKYDLRKQYEALDDFRAKLSLGVLALKYYPDDDYFIAEIVTPELKRGNSAYQSGNYVKAQDHYRRVLDYHPSNPTVRQKLGQAGSAEKNRLAKIAKDKRIATENRKFSDFISSGDGAARRGDYVTALKDYKSALSIKPNEVSVSNKIREIEPKAKHQSFRARVGMKFMKIPGGSFQMGSNNGDSDEKPVHRVTVSSFYMLSTEVTQRMWKEVMGNNPSNWKGDNLPVEKVSWNDCQKFVSKLNSMYPGHNYRLPTESEWEYACRAGTSTKYYSGNSDSDLGRVGWYDDNSSSKTHSVGQKGSNSWGLYDMHGNVWEWCEDWKGDYSSRSVTNPKGSSSGSSRVLRGGCWSYEARSCRSAYRRWYDPGVRYAINGFRLVCAD